jgi:hypothetical protein
MLKIVVVILRGFLLLRLLFLYREDCYCCIEKIVVVISRTSLKVRLGMFCEGVMSHKERLPSVTGISSDLKI